MKEKIAKLSALSSSSTNPVQNSVVTNALANKQDAVTDIGWLDINMDYWVDS